MAEISTGTKPMVWDKRVNRKGGLGSTHKVCAAAETTPIHMIQRSLGYLTMLLLVTLLQIHHRPIR
jgi:hypothetical protein